MPDSSQNNKRIAKNTLMLYIRMFFIMGISLYTTRIILSILGIEDYGIYGVVGGVVGMLNFVQNSLSGASSRYITYTLGTGDLTELKNLFSVVKTIHGILATIIVLIGETVGLWFVYNKLIIPPDRMSAALWVYHCSILTTVISIVSVPYNSLIIAHEQMKAFAQISVLEVILKLAIVFSLQYIQFDRLVVYSVLVLLVQLFIRMTYNLYCLRNFPETKSSFIWKTREIKEILVYAVWTMNGNLALMGYTHGLNILLNMYFGPIVNAARGIAVQVQSAVQNFVSNFQTAITPQIIKSYASNDLKYMHFLVLASSKFGIFLNLILVFPLIICIDPILSLWLGEVPIHTISFVRIILMTSLIWSLRTAMRNSIHATGDIKKFQMYEATTMLMLIPVAWICLRFFYISPEMVMSIYFLTEVCAQCVRIWIVLPKIKMSYYVYIREVLIPLFLLSPFFLVPYMYFKFPEQYSIIILIQYVVIAILYAALCIFIIGMNKRERMTVINYLSNIIIRSIR